MHHILFLKSESATFQLNSDSSAESKVERGAFGHKSLIPLAL